MDEDQIRPVLEGIRALAVACGYPGRERDRLRRFDREAGPLLLQGMGISAHQAARPGVWQWIACEAIPDLVRWRFKAQPGTGRVNDERFMRINRNVVGRLWWRSWILQDGSADDPWHLLALSEDNLVAITERTRSIASCRPLAQAFARECLTVEANRRMPVMRDATKRVLRTLSVYPLRCMPHDLIALHVQRAFAASLAAVREQEPPAVLEEE